MSWRERGGLYRTQWTLIFWVVVSWAMTMVGATALILGDDLSIPVMLVLMVAATLYGFCVGVLLSVRMFTLARRREREEAEDVDDLELPAPYVELEVDRFSKELSDTDSFWSTNHFGNLERGRGEYDWRKGLDEK